MLLAGDLLPVRAESGELVLLRPKPEALNELHRFRVFLRLNLESSGVGRRSPVGPQ